MSLVTTFLLNSPTVIDVSGDAGGGHITVGRNDSTDVLSHATVIEPGVTLLANAINSGNGGLIETSGDYLDVGAVNINLNAPHGKKGTWLLDPYDLNITAAADSNVNNTIPNDIFATGETGNLSVATLEAALANGNVTVETRASEGLTGNGDINIETPINWANSELTISAYRNINITAGSTITGTGTAVLNLIADNANAFDLGSGQGTVNVPANTFNVAGGINIGYLPSAYTSPVSYAGTNSAGPAPTGFMLLASRADFNTLSSTSALWVGDFGISTNINLGATPFQAIGGGTGPTYFSGIFNGFGNVITYTQNTNVFVSGVFTVITGTVENLGAATNLTGSPVVGFQQVGILAGGILNGLVENCFTEGTVSASNGIIGGLVGFNNAGTILNSYSTATVIGNSNTDIGGLVGLNENNIPNPTLGIISNSYSTGTVIGGSGSNAVGGLVGDNHGGTISDSWSGSNVSGATNVGGLVGLDDLNPTTGAGPTISNSYAIGSVTGVLNVGGFIGSQTGSTASTSNSYASGAVSGAANVGGFIGSYDGTGTVSNNFWDTATSGQFVGIGSGPTAGATGGCFAGGSCANGGTANLSAAATYSGAGWSIGTDATTDTWLIFDGETRPMLASEFGNGISDAHSLQLLDLNATTLADSYDVTNNMSLSTTNASDIWGGGSWIPIAGFSGTLNGNNFVLSNLTVNEAGGTNVGLFASSSGAIGNVSLTNASVNGLNDVGILVGNNTGVITTAAVSGIVTGANGGSGIGGMVGTATTGSNITDSESSATVSAAGSSLVGGLIGENTGTGTLADVYSTGSVTGSSFVGGLIGENAGTAAVGIQNAYSTGAVTGGLNTGGFVGANTATITDAYSTGKVSSGSTNSGGFSGYNAGTINNSFWDIQTSGEGSGAGAGPGTATLTGGCLSNSCSTNLSLQSTYPWDFANTWGIINGQSYPYLLAFYPATPRALSGKLTGDTGGTTVNLAISGANFDSTTTGANGEYYFLDGNNIITGTNDTISDNTPLLFYLASGATTGNLVADAPVSSASLINLNFTSNNIAFGTNVSSTDMATAVGSLSSPFILYSSSGNNVVLGNGIDLTTPANITFTLNSNVSASTASNITFNGTLALGASGVTLNPGTTLGAVNILGNLVGNNHTLVLNVTDTNAANNTISGNISGLLSLTLTGGGTINITGSNTGFSGSTIISNGSLEVSNANALGTGTVTVNPTGVLVLDDVTLGGVSNININGAGFNNAGTITGIGLGTDAIANTVGITLGSDATIGSSTSAISILGNIGGAHQLTIAGTTPTTLAGNNNYSGGTVISTNETIIDNNNALGTGAVTVDSGATLGIDPGITLSGVSSLTLNGTGVGGNGSLINTGIGGTGTAAVSNGVGVVLGSNSTIGGASGITDIAGSISDGGNGFSLTTAGNNEVELDGNNAYSGGTNVLGNVLLITNGNALGTGAAVVSSGGTLEVQGVNLTGISGLTINGNGSSATVGVLNSGTSNGSIDNSVPVTLGSNVTIGGGSSTLTINGAINGGFSLTKFGTDTLILGADNGYTAGTTINNGVLEITNGNALGIGAVVVNSPGTLSIDGVTLSGAASLTINGASPNGALNSVGTAGDIDVPVILTANSTVGGGTADLTISGAISGNFNVDKVGTDTVTFANGSNSYGGTTTITDGTLQLGANDAIPDTSPVIIATTGILALNGFDQSIPNLTGSGAINLGSGTLTDGSDGTSTTYSGVISGTGNFDKVGGGTLILGGANLYSGATNIEDGAIEAGIVNAIGSSSDVDVSSGATFNLNGNNDTIGSLAGAGGVSLGGATLTTGDTLDTTYSGIISGNGNLVKQGTDKFTLTNNNSYNGATTVNNGTLANGTDNALPTGTALTVTSPGTFDLNNNSQEVSSVVGNGTVTNTGATTGTFTINNASADTSGNQFSGNMNLVKENTGTLTLTNPNNNYTGFTHIIAGTLMLGANNVLPDTSAIILDPSTLIDFNGFNDTLGSISGDGEIDFGNSTFISNSNTNTTFSGSLVGTAGFTKQGTGTLNLATANNSLSGTTTVAGGILELSNANALGSTSSVLVDNGASLELNGTTPATSMALTLNGTGVGAAGALIDSGIATWSGNISLASNSSIGTLIAGDVLTITGTINGNAGLTLSGPGTIILDGAVGNSQALASFTSNAGTTDINGGSVHTTGAQNYNDPTYLGAATNFTTNNSNINFASSLDSFGGTPENVTANSGSGSIDFAGNVGATHQVGNMLLTSSGTTTFGGSVNAVSVTINGGGTTHINGGTVTTTGAQTYNEEVILGAATTTTGSAIAMNDGVLGGQALTINSPGSIFLAGPFNITQLTTNGTSDSSNVTIVNNQPETITITGMNSGTLSGVVGIGSPVSFSNQSNLSGNGGNTIYVIEAGGSLSGSITGSGSDNTLIDNNRE